MKEVITRNGITYRLQVSSDDDGFIEFLKAELRDSGRKFRTFKEGDRTLLYSN